MPCGQCGFVIASAMDSSVFNHCLCLPISDADNFKSKMKLIVCILSTLVLVVSAARHSELRNLRLVAEWKQPEFEFPSPSIRQAAIGSRQYVPGNAVPIDVDVDYRSSGTSRVFVTIPRFTTGIPITLGTVSTARADGGPLIQAYPEYSWHSSHGQNCDGITSVFRVAVIINS